MSATNLNQLESDIQTFGDEIVNELKAPYIESDVSVTHEVTESSTIFSLPSNVDNYADPSFYIICTIDGVETTSFSLNEQNFVPILELYSAVSSGTVVIRAIKFKDNFISFIFNNMPLG